MPVKQPGKRLLHAIPLKFVHDKVAGGGRKSTDAQIVLVPFIDFLIVLVVFLLTSFSSTGELLAQQPDLKMPDAANAEALAPSPVVSISQTHVLLDGTAMADVQTLAQNAQVDRIERLVQDLEVLKRNWTVLHPNDQFQGELILQVDKNTDFRVVKKVMFSAGQAGYPNVHFAVNQKGSSGK